MKLLISACLLGVPCRYDGRSKTAPGVERLLEKHVCIPVCPEQLGGLATPREPAECRNGRVYTKSGGDVTEQYRRGAAAALHLAKLYGCTAAVLKERSPSCGKGAVHDGTFSGGMTAGDGAAAALLEENGIRVLRESQIEELV